MIKEKSEERAERAVALIGGEVEDELRRLFASRVSGASGVREISLRAGGRCSVLIDGERIDLLSSLECKDMEEIMTALCEGALYAHRDTIAEGYLTLEGGIRVGVGGRARYEHRAFVGVTDIRTLVFRIPGHKCDFDRELEEIYRERPIRGMMIYSLPGVGKTTALRALSARLGSGKHPVRVAVVDERCEFDTGDYGGCEVDILRGYRRKRGIEIATRTMSAELIMIDEIGADDAEDLLRVVKCGIPLVATAHAGSYEELCRRAALSPLIDGGVFDLFVGISRERDGYVLTVDRS